jgi:protein-S-isoprenylcysteine O-methyltransferase Ste14
MDTNGLENTRYYVALFTIVGVPPGILFWFLMHPFAQWWRRIGAIVTYSVIIPILLSIGYAFYRVREPVLQLHFGLSIPLTIMAALLFLAGVYIGVKRIRYLTPSVMFGVPEVSRNKTSQKLITNGIYGKVRHPRYLEAGFILTAIALFTNYLAVYLLLIAYIPAIYLVVQLEERELRERFGKAYEHYCRDVPQFIPYLRWRKNRRRQNNE